MPRFDYTTDLRNSLAVGTVLGRHPERGQQLPRRRWSAGHCLGGRQSWRPPAAKHGSLSRHVCGKWIRGRRRGTRCGNCYDDRLYNQKDFDHHLVIDAWTTRVATWVSDYLKHSGDRLQKSIVFCVDSEHAARVRQAFINENKDLAQHNARYVMRITSDDTEGTAQLGNFIDPEAKYPVIVTTSRLLCTGVDAQTCRLIVLDRSAQPSHNWVIFEWRQKSCRISSPEEESPRERPPP
jgi:hypothetical protein